MDPDSYLLSQIFCALSIDAPSVGVVVAIVLALFLLFVIGFVSASEMSLFSLASSDLQSLDDKSPKDRLIKVLLENPDRLLATIHVANGLSSKLFIEFEYSSCRIDEFPADRVFLFA